MHVALVDGDAALAVLPPLINQAVANSPEQAALIAFARLLVDSKPRIGEARQQALADSVITMPYHRRRRSMLNVFTLVGTRSVLGIRREVGGQCQCGDDSIDAVLSVGSVPAEHGRQKRPDFHREIRRRQEPSSPRQGQFYCPHAQRTPIPDNISNLQAALEQVSNNANALRQLLQQPPPLPAAASMVPVGAAVRSRAVLVKEEALLSEIRASSQLLTGLQQQNPRARQIMKEGGVTKVLKDALEVRITPHCTCTAY